MEALKSLYGTSRKADIDMSTVNKNKTQKIIMPSFIQITKYIYTEAETRIKDNTKKFTIGNHVLAFPVAVYTEVQGEIILNIFFYFLFFFFVTDPTVFTFMSYSKSRSTFN